MADNEKEAIPPEYPTSSTQPQQLASATPTYHLPVQPSMIVYEPLEIPPEFQPPDYLPLAIIVGIICAFFNITSLFLSFPALIFSVMAINYKSKRQYVIAKRMGMAALIFILLTVLWDVAWAITIMALITWFWWFVFVPSLEYS